MNRKELCYYFIKEIWRIFPFRWMVNLITRLTLVSTTLMYLDSVNKSSLLTSTILTIWAVTPIYDMLRSIYYDLMGCQDERTLLWNKLERSIRDLNIATEKRIKAKKQRIWVERNPEIHIFNYWILKYIRKDEWINIDIEEDSVKEVDSE